MSDLTKMVTKTKQVEIDGEVYTFQQMNIKDWSVLHEFAEDEYYADMKKRLAALPVESEQFKQLADKIQTAKRSEIIPELIEYTAGVKASILQAWLMLKHNHSEITKEQVENLPFTYSQFLDIAEELSQRKGTDDSKKEEQQSS